MPIATFGDRPEGIRVEQFDIKTGEFNGEWIKGGPLQDFSSTGILDKATIYIRLQEVVAKRSKLGTIRFLICV